jgi:hypothetical protein
MQKLGEHAALLLERSMCTTNLHRHSGPCRLCLRIAPLVDSHIIPNFQFKGLKRVEGRFYELSTDHNVPERKQQRGFTERLMCAECDNRRLQQNEDYFARVWTRGSLPEPQQHGRVLIFRNHDYKRCKNYLLSILWRMSISSLEVFKEVSLGPKHEEVLRAGLLADREFEEREYAVTITAPLIDGRFYEDFILQPDAVRLDGNRLYRCVIAGMLYTFFVGSAPQHPVMHALSLRRDEFPITKMEVADIPFLSHAISRIGYANKTRESSKGRPPIHSNRSNDAANHD